MKDNKFWNRAARNVFWAGALFFLLMFGVRSAEAQVPPQIAKQKNFDDLVAEAEVILAGTVTDKQSVWADDKSTIYTFVTLSDLEVVDGDYKEETFVLRFDGGETDDGQGLKVSGVPEINLDERIVVFIEGNTSRICPLVGDSQGLFRVKQDPETGEERLVSPQGDEIAGVNEEGQIVVKPPQDNPEWNDIQVEFDDPVNEELYLMQKEARKKAKEELVAKEFTFKDLKSLVKAKAATLKKEGKKKTVKAAKADMNLHRKGRSVNPAKNGEGAR